MIFTPKVLSFWMSLSAEDQLLFHMEAVENN